MSSLLIVHWGKTLGRIRANALTQEPGNLPSRRPVRQPGIAEERGISFGDTTVNPGCRRCVYCFSTIGSPLNIQRDFAMSSKTFLYTTSLLALSFSLSQSAVAQIDADTDIETIEITGTRIASSLDQIGRSVSVITAEEIEIRQQRFLYETLQNIPGLQVTRSGSFGALATISIRGLASDQTLVVQDGVVVNDPSSFGNGFNFANFDTSDVERIEVLRGAQSTLYGSDAIGGVINIVTKDGGEGFGFSGFAEAGSFGTFRGSASVRGGTEILSGRISIAGTTTDGFSTADEANGNTEDDGFDNFTVAAKGRFQPSESFRIEAIARYQNSENEFDSFTFQPVDGDEIGESDELTLAGFAYLTLLDGVLENRVSVTYYENERLNLTDGVPSFDASGDRISYEYQGTVRPSDQLALIAGFEFDEQTSEVAVGFGGNQEIETTSVFGLAQFTPNEVVTLNAGIRHDDVDVFGAETTFSVSGVVNIPGTNTRIRASYAEGFRAPTAGELSFNPDLFAEFSDGWDIGIEQSFFDGDLTLQATYFDQSIDDLIAFDLAIFSFLNVQEFDTSGVEVGLNWKASDQFSINATYTYLDAFNVSTTLAAGNQPDNRFTAEVVYKPNEDFTLSAGLLFNGDEIDGATVLQDFTLVNVRASYQITDTIEIFGRIENALDEDYQDNLGFGTAPLSAFGGIRASF